MALQQGSKLHHHTTMFGADRAHLHQPAFHQFEAAKVGPPFEFLSSDWARGLVHGVVPHRILASS